MSFIECMKSELDLFRPRNIQTNILKTEELSYKPLTSLENQSVIEFVCQGSGDTYIDLSSINLRLKLQLTKSDGSLYVEADENQPGLCNNIMHSLFRQVNISLNGKSINSADGNYSYRAMLETLLNYGSDANDTHLNMVGWDGMDKKKLDNFTENDGWKKRQSLFKNSSVVELYGKLHCDLMNQPLLLLNNVTVRIALTLNKPEFYLLTQNVLDASVVKILDASLYVKHCTINPNILIAHHKMLERTNAQYHYKRCEIKSFTVGRGNSLNIDNIVLGQLPTSLIFVMVDNDAYTGRKTKDPFNFKHNKITTFSLFVNGAPVPHESITMDFSEGNHMFARAYASIFEASGLLHTPQGNLITKDMFANGHFMIAQDLTADLSGCSACSSLLNQGNIRIEARFCEPLTNTITCLIFLEYDATLEIDKNRNVIL